MRIAVLVIGLMLTIGLFIQAALIAGLSDAANDEESGAAAAVGIVMALMWLVSCGLVIPTPRVSMVLFALAGLFGFLAAGEYPDLAIWGGISEVLAVFSYLGYRGKRKNDRKEAERDAMFRQMANPQPVAVAQTIRCPQCNSDVPVSVRFCPNCGLARPVTP